MFENQPASQTIGVICAAVLAISTVTYVGAGLTNDPVLAVNAMFVGGTAFTVLLVTAICNSLVTPAIKDQAERPFEDFSDHQIDSFIRIATRQVFWNAGECELINEAHLEKARRLSQLIAQGRGEA